MGAHVRLRVGSAAGRTQALTTAGRSRALALFHLYLLPCLSRRSHGLGHQGARDQRADRRPLAGLHDTLLPPALHAADRGGHDHAGGWESFCGRLGSGCPGELASLPKETEPNPAQCARLGYSCRAPPSTAALWLPTKPGLHLGGGGLPVGPARHPHRPGRPGPQVCSSALAAAHGWGASLLCIGHHAQRSPLLPALLSQGTWPCSACLPATPAHAVPEAEIRKEVQRSLFSRLQRQLHQQLVAPIRARSMRRPATPGELELALCSRLLTQ